MGAGVVVQKSFCFDDFISQFIPDTCAHCSVLQISTTLCLTEGRMVDAMDWSGLAIGFGAEWRSAGLMMFVTCSK